MLAKQKSCYLKNHKYLYFIIFISEMYFRKVQSEQVQQATDSDQIHNRQTQFNQIQCLHERKNSTSEVRKQSDEWRSKEKQFFAESSHRLNQVEERLKKVEKILSENIQKINQQTMNSYHEAKKIDQLIIVEIQDIKKDHEELKKKQEDEDEAIKVSVLNLNREHEKNVEKMKKIQQQVRSLSQKINQSIGKKSYVNWSHSMQLKKEQQEQQFSGNNEKLKQLGKQEPQKLIDNTTSLFKHFEIDKNRIKMAEGLSQCQQILMNVVISQEPFAIKIHINKGSRIMLGVVDRDARKLELNSARSGFAVCYAGYLGRIQYGDCGGHKSKETNDCFCDGMDVIMKVDMSNAFVTFILKGQMTSPREYQVQSDILLSGRIFVPYFQMKNKGDSVSWQIL